MIHPLLSHTLLRVMLCCAVQPLCDYLCQRGHDPPAPISHAAPCYAVLCCAVQPLCDYLCQRGHDFGGKQLLGCTLWTYYYGELMPPPHHVYGTWHQASIIAFEPATGEHVVSEG